jgi:GNAT superfamily N-acetyltransferase
MTEKAAEYEVAPARWPEDLEQARALLKNYGEYLASSSSRAAGVCIPGYEAELRGLPGKYAGREADLLLARVNSEGAGCVAITRRVLKDGMDAAEMKRLWVEPRFRGHGLGRRLVLSAIDWARGYECNAVVLDTVNEAMPEAALLYSSLGFEEITRFNENPISGVRFYRLMLST